MISLIYKVFIRIKKHFERGYIISQLNFSSDNARKNCIIDDNVKIYNKNVYIGDNVHLFSNVIIWGDGKVEISDGTKIGFNTIIYASKSGGVFIGHHTAIAANCYIIDSNHTLSPDRMEHPSDSVKKITIGNNVWIGANCVCAKGSSLGDGAVLGACSFLNTSIPDRKLAVGSPAKVIKDCI